MTADQLARIRRAARNIPVIVPHAGTRLLSRYVEMLVGAWTELRSDVAHLRIAAIAAGDERDRQAARITELEALVATLSERCAAQSELLSRRAEGT